MASPDLTPFMQRQSSVQQDFAAKSAANTFSRTLSQQRGSRQQADFTQSFNRGLPSFGAGFARRRLSGGGVSSGVFQNAMQNYVGDYTKNLGRMQEDIFNQDRQFEFDQARFTAERDQALADIASQKAALIAQTAQQINALKPYMGGF